MNRLEEIAYQKQLHRKAIADKAVPKRASKPTTKATNAELRSWLTSQGIDSRPKDSKAELLEKVADA